MASNHYWNKIKSGDKMIIWQCLSCSCVSTPPTFFSFCCSLKAHFPFLQAGTRLVRVVFLSLFIICLISVELQLKLKEMLFSQSLWEMMRLILAWKIQILILVKSSSPRQTPYSLWLSVPTRGKGSSLLPAWCLADRPGWIRGRGVFIGGRRSGEWVGRSRRENSSRWVCQWHPRLFSIVGRQGLA